MASDVWTLHLQCEGAAPGHEHVQREMDKDMICFFNLMEFVEEYGCTSIDYLYYKRRDSLVAIEMDTDVMEMLKDNETTKEVSLFVTMQRMAFMASKSKKASTKSAPNKTKRRKSGAKSKECLHVIQTKSKYANDIDQQHDDDIQEPSGMLHLPQPMICRIS
ncbi:hypothetical protein PVAP13_8NG303855 [Panicum virgatum]|uniref:PB1-like domain-containing protein n=1 Tax=Panicum virgatum TaxID=38727 RepID=A0A8T0PFG6_PANVG|nr:hypothetical protein PVAP13_8NG303855 [Panicum virgatum]